MNLIITLFVILVIAYLFTVVGKRVKISGVVALLLCGLVLGIPFFKEWIYAKKVIGVDERNDSYSCINQVIFYDYIEIIFLVDKSPDHINAKYGNQSNDIKKMDESQ